MVYSGLEVSSNQMGQLVNMIPCLSTHRAHDPRRSTHRATDGPPGGRQATISERGRAAESNPILALFYSNRQAKLLAYSLNCAS